MLAQTLPSSPSRPISRPVRSTGPAGAGYGTGAYGVGTYGTPSTTDYFPMTWSLGNWGGFLLANPRHGTIYVWDSTAPGRATAIPGAPANVTYMLSMPQRQVIALGCNEEVSGVWNPLCIRWCDIEDYTDWTSTPQNNAGEWILESGGRIVCGRVIGDYALVWTTDGLFLGTYVGAPGQTWEVRTAGLALRLDQPRLPGGVVAERCLDQPQQGFLAVHPGRPADAAALRRAADVSGSRHGGAGRQDHRRVGRDLG